MASPVKLSLPGFIFNIISTIPLIVYCVTNRSNLPEICASHFDIHNQPNGYMSRDSFFWFSLLFPIGLTALFDIISFSTLCIPLSAYNGVDVEYYKRHDRFVGLKARMMNVMFFYGAILSLFLFSVFVPNWEYNKKCEINPENPVPCDYKIVFWPQLIFFIVLLILVSLLFWCCLKKSKDGRILDQSEEENWHCAFYVNSDDERVFVPKRFGIGYTVNLGNPCGISFMVVILLIPVVVVGLLALFACPVCYSHVDRWIVY